MGIVCRLYDNTVCVCAFAGEGVIKDETKKGKARCQRELNILSLGFLL